MLPDADDFRNMPHTLRASTQAAVRQSATIAVKPLDSRERGNDMPRSRFLRCFLSFVVVFCGNDTRGYFFTLRHHT
jgi:hypothetical protein